MTAISRWLWLLVAATLLGVSAVGVWTYRDQEHHLGQEIEQRLGAIAHLKVDEIVTWREERLADASMLSASPFLAEAVARWMDQPREELSASLRAYFTLLQGHDQYQEVILVHPDGEVRFSLGNTERIETEPLETVRAAMAVDRPMLTDIYYDTRFDSTRISTIAPLVRNDGEAEVPVGAIMLVSDPRKYLYPRIQTWPVPSDTAESLLVRRDGDDVLFLNTLRHVPDTMLKLRRPLSQTNLPAAAAILGTRGIVRGLDYRGVDVIASVEPVPESPWYVVAKEDYAEAFAVWRFRAVLLLGVFLGVAAMVVAFLLVVWQRNQKAHYRTLYRAEAARHASEIRYGVTLKSIGDGVIATDDLGRVELINPVAEGLTGWTNDEARGRPLEDIFRIVNEETRETVENPVARVMRDGKVIGLANHTCLIARDGTERPIADSGAPIWDAQQRLQGVVLVFRDQTDECNARNALDASEKAHRTLVTSLPDIILRMDRDGRIRFVSPNAETLLGAPAAQAYGKHYRDIGLPESVAGFWESTIEHAMTCRHIVETELAVPRAEETTVFNWRLVPDFDAQGSAQGVLSLCRDITEHRAAIENYEMLFREMTEGCALHEIIWDSEGNPVDYRFLAINPAFTHLTGLSADIVGNTVRDVMPNTESHWIEAYGRVARTGVPESFCAYSQVLDKHFEVTAFRPAINQFVCMFSDVTERERAAEEREQLQGRITQMQRLESVGRLAGGVAHDFNNMLEVILGNAELALDAIEPSHAIAAELLEIQKAAIRSADLTRQLLAFARKQTIAPQVLDMNEAVQGMLTILRRLIGKDIDLTWIPATDLWRVRIDPAQIDQILANLCINARDAIDGGGKVAVETHNVTFDAAYCEAHPGSGPGDYVLLAVSDNGCGMDRETREKIFEPFFTTKPHGEGTGLGLATVYGIVKQNDGFIDVYSEPGSGTTFKIHMPRFHGEASNAEAPVRSVNLPAGHGETVLLLEDETAILELGNHMLESLGYKVLSADTPTKALDIATAHSCAIDLLITDVVMPEMNGRELSARLHAICPAVKTLFMSGYTADVIAHQGVLEPGVHFLQKPFSRHELAIKIRQVLDRP